MTFAVLPEGGMTSPSGRSRRGSHQLAAFAVCPRLSYYRYIEGWVQKHDKETRLRGTLIHLAMAYYYASLMPVKPPWFYEKDLFTALQEKGVGLPDGVRRAKEVLAAYQQKHPQENWQPLSVEDEFFATLGELDPLDDELTRLQAKAATPDSHQEAAAFRLQRLEYLKTFDDEIVSCRPDLICLDERGATWIVDHKSRGKPWGSKKGLASWKNDGEFLLDWQVMVNLHITRTPANVARLGGNFPIGFVIQRLTRQPDANGYYFSDRNVLTVPKKAYDAAPRRIREAVALEHETRQQIANGLATAQNFWACMGRYGECDYRPVCAASSDAEAADVLQSCYKLEARTAQAEDVYQDEE